MTAAGSPEPKVPRPLSSPNSPMTSGPNPRSALKMKSSFPGGLRAGAGARLPSCQPGSGLEGSRD